MARADHLHRWLAPGTRLIWGLGLIAVLALTPTWPARLVLTAVGAVAALAAGKKIQFLYFAFLVLSVTVFNLFVPFGKVLFRWGGFLFTEGALSEGLAKGLTLCGFIFLSLASVSRYLKFPGAWGQLWGQTFAFYERLLEVKKKLDPKNFWSSLDNLLESAYQAQDPPAETVSPKTSRAGWLLIAVSAVGALTLILLGRTS
ncbi:MAG: hypothetical protein HKM05_04120 [Spirochaetales bacterium]|nr:hypothetical protein [Spirochaetales bacterium]